MSTDANTLAAKAAQAAAEQKAAAASQALQNNKSVGFLYGIFGKKVSSIHLFISYNSMSTALSIYVSLTY